MSRTSLEAFLQAAGADPVLQEQLLVASDAASLAAIACAAGYPVSEADWLLASGADPEEQAAAAEPEPPDPLTAFLHQAQGDPELQGALAQALDAADVAAIARAAGYPITTADLWAASGAAPHELVPDRGFPEEGLPDGPSAAMAIGGDPLDAPNPDFPGDPAVEPEAAAGSDLEDLSPAGQELLEAFLRQLEGDPQLQEALLEAADAAAVAEIARAAGHPLREADIWLASGLEPQALHAPPAASPDPLREALTAFLHQAQGDPRLGDLLAEAADAAAVAEIAQAAGYPITAADLWEASGAASEELVV